MSLAKTTTVFMLATAWTTTLAQAGFKVPMSVFRMDELERAQAAAQAKEMPIAFLYSDENTGCSLCTKASVKIMDELKSRCVIVYVDQRKNFVGYPASVIQALHAPEGGNTIPKTIVMDSALEKPLLFIPYAKDEALDEALKQARKTLAPPPPAGNSSARRSRSATAP
jgi:hypothetical protein